MKVNPLEAKNVATINIIDFPVGIDYTKNTLHFFLQDVQRFAAIEDNSPCTLQTIGSSLTVIWEELKEQGVEEKFFGKLFSNATFLDLIGAKSNRISKTQITIHLDVTGVSWMKAYSNSRIHIYERIREISEEERHFRILQCIHFASIAGRLYYSWLNAKTLASYSNLHWLCLAVSEMTTLKNIIDNTDQKNHTFVIFAKSMLLTYIREYPKTNANKGSRYLCWTFHSSPPTDDDIFQVVEGIQSAAISVMRTKYTAPPTDDDILVAQASVMPRRNVGKFAVQPHVVDFIVGEAYRKQTIHFFWQDVQQFAAKGLCTLETNGISLTVQWNSLEVEKTVQEVFFRRMILTEKFLNLTGAKIVDIKGPRRFTIMLPQPEPMVQVTENEFKILQCIHFTNNELFYAWLDSTDVASFSNLHWLCLTPSNTSKREVSNPDICKLEKLAKYLLYQYLRQFDKDLVRPEGKPQYLCWTFHGKKPFKAIADDVQAVDRLQNTWSADVSHNDPSALMQSALDSTTEAHCIAAADTIPIKWSQRDTSPLDFQVVEGIQSAAASVMRTKYTAPPTDDDILVAQASVMPRRNVGTFLETLQGGLDAGASMLERRRGGRLKCTQHVVDFIVGDVYRKQTMHFFWQDVQQFAAKGLCTFETNSTFLTVHWNSLEVEETVQEVFFRRMILTEKFLILTEARIDVVKKGPKYFTIILPQPEPMEQVTENEFKILQCIHFTNNELFYAWLDSTKVASFSNLHWLCLTPNNCKTRQVSQQEICKLENLAKYLLYQYLRKLETLHKTRSFSSGFTKCFVRPEGKTLYYCWTFNGEMPFKAIADDVQAVDRLQNTWSADVSHDDPSALMQPALDSIWSTEASDANPIERDTSPLNYFWSSEASEAIPMERDTSQRPWNWSNEGPSTDTHEYPWPAREFWNWSNEGPSTMNWSNEGPSTDTHEHALSARESWNWSNEGPSTMNWSNQGY